MKIIDLVPKFISEIEPYKVRSEINPLINHNRILKLDWNESTVQPSQKIIDEVLSFISKGNLNLYPKIVNPELMLALSEYCNISKDMIEIFNGADSACESICRTFLEVDDEVIILQPTYDNFRIAAVSTGAKIKNVLLNDPFNPTTDDIFSNITEKTKVIYLVNPNNPTGYYLKSEKIQSILENFKGILIVDEAYYEFNKQSVSDLLSNYNNLIILRSFSKAFGLAGVRLGYLLANEKIINFINLTRNSKSVNIIAQVAGLAALKNIDYMHKYTEDIAESKIFIENECRNNSYNFEMTPANFFLLKVDDPDHFVNELKKIDIFIRNRSSMHGLKGYVRITIGTKCEMKILFDSIKVYFEKWKLEQSIK